MNTPTIIQITNLHPFEGHPFRVKDNDEMEALVDSIREFGILTPLIVRPLENAQNEYEVVSGHRRLHAAKRAGIHEVPVQIYVIDRDTAAVMLVDSNLHREHLLPSEKAFAYKLKLDALKRQGKRSDLTSSQVATKWNAAARVGEAANDSADKVHRYIRLTHLIPELLQLVDEGRIALTPAVALSYLRDQEQYDLLETIESEDCTPSLSQAQRMKQFSEGGHLSMDAIFRIMSEPKPNQREKIVFRYDDLRRFFPNHSTKEIHDTILRLIESEFQRQQRARRDRDAR
ncbi:MAG: ParB/RepB/Spo0J family partition protein [Oscillospiraceae bacterium]|nr:ParB/RepB/Spo0J family partition protein [Oscillospiraceae bacterium]